MNIKLDDLIDGTEFRLDGCVYQKTNQYGMMKGEWCKENEYLLNPSYEGQFCCLVHPKLGGKFQKAVRVWIDQNEKVLVS